MSQSQTFGKTSALFSTPEAQEARSLFGRGRSHSTSAVTDKGPCVGSALQFTGSVPTFRLILTRHGQSANRGRAKGVPASKDPDLTELGYRQAQGLGEKLNHLGPGWKREAHGPPLVVTSPMKRCLLTILPALQMLELPRESCLCHGGAFEFGCAGRDHTGSLHKEISAEFPEFQPVEFSPDGYWDYRGASGKESEQEFCARGKRMAQWLLTNGLGALRAQTDASAGSGLPTLILCIHQTLGDFLSHLLLEGSAERWVYADARYKMDNASFSELLVYADGRAKMQTMNACSHLPFV